MHVLFLGTGNAFASGGRNTMAILLRAGSFGVLLDCGPTTLVALKKAGLSPADVDVILLSHHHGDHFGGVPFLVLHEQYESKRRKPLYVLGPDETKKTLSSAMELFFRGAEDVEYPLEYRDLRPGEELSIGGLKARAFEVDHYSNGTAFGYRVELGGRSLVFSGDTTWTEALVAQTANTDLFICECSSFDAPIERHMHHRDLEKHRDRIGSRRTLLVHAGDDVLAHEAELVFELAHDGMEVNL